MAFLTNEVISLFDGVPGPSVHQNTLAIGQKVWKGSLPLIVGGKVYRGGPVPSAGLLAVAGVDGNGGLNLFSNQPNVRYSQLGGTSQTLGVSVVFNASTVDIVVQLGTNGGATVTSTAANVLNALLAHATASKYLQANYTGTGAGLAAAFTAALVPVVSLAGVAMNTYDNSGGATDLTTSMLFQRAVVAVAPLSTDAPTSAMIGSRVALVDDITVKATVGPLDLTVQLSDILPDGTVFVVV